MEWIEALVGVAVGCISGFAIYAMASLSPRFRRLMFRRINRIYRFVKKDIMRKWSPFDEWWFEECEKPVGESEVYK